MSFPIKENTGPSNAKRSPTDVQPKLSSTSLLNSETLTFFVSPMASHSNIEIQQPPSIHSPLIVPDQTHEPIQEPPNPHLDQTLKRLETYLSFMGFHQTSLFTLLLSWFVFLIMGVLIPAFMISFTSSPKYEEYEVSKFEFYNLASQASLAAVSLLCISHSLRKHGLKKFLFVDKDDGCVTKLHQEYVERIKDFYRLLILWASPCFSLKIFLETVRSIYMYGTCWKSVGIMLISVNSWTCLTTISLSACLLFNLVCNLQVIHFDEYGKLFESTSDVLVLLKEHMRLRRHLSKISHRFRIYLLLMFLLVTTSQVLTLFQATGDRVTINAINGGNFVVVSIAQAVGLALCLHAAAKISHRAQGIASVATRWHALVTCSDSGINGMGNSDPAIPVGSRTPIHSDADLDLVENVTIFSNGQMSSYHKRQSLVIYLQSNLGGLTIFGWTVDRMMMHTLFFVELSLVTFVLGKTVVDTTE